MTPDERAEVATTLSTLQRALEGLVVRGVRSAGPDELKSLRAMHDELERVGASYLAGRVQTLVEKTKSGDDGAPGALFGALTTLRVFDRVVTLHAAAEALAALDDDDAPDADASSVRRPLTPALSPPGEREELRPLLRELAGSVESLVMTGLTTASAATRQKLEVSFKEASRLKLLRLSASLRYVNEELGRFLKDVNTFSAKRFTFFLSRSWLIARGLIEAIDENNREWIARLLLAREPTPVKKLRFAVLGVHKRVAIDGACSFDFRLRALGDGAFEKGTPLVWSCFFPGKPGVPAEAFLHLPQAQKFAPKLLLEGKQYEVTDCAIAASESGGAARLMLGPKSTVTAVGAFDDWPSLLNVDWAKACDRAAGHQVTPLELEVELQEEVVLDGWTVSGPTARDDDKQLFEVSHAGLQLTTVVGKTAGDLELTKALKDAAKKKAPKGALFGLMHYETCQLMFQPLSVVNDDGVKHLMISDEKFSVAALVGSLDFR